MGTIASQRTAFTLSAKPWPTIFGISDAVNKRPAEPSAPIRRDRRISFATVLARLRDSCVAKLEESGERGVTDGEDGHRGKVDETIRHRIDTVLLVHSVVAEHRFVEIVVDRTRRAGERESHALKRVPAGNCEVQPWASKVDDCQDDGSSGGDAGDTCRRDGPLEGGGVMYGEEQTEDGECSEGTD